MLLTFCFVCLFRFDLSAQSAEKKIIQFSGVVVKGDSLKPVPFTNIFVTGSRNATVSDYYGFFSFAAEEGSDITFSAVGFKKAHFVIPDTCNEKRYSMIQILFLDTISFEDFLNDFLLQSIERSDWLREELFIEAVSKFGKPCIGEVFTFVPLPSYGGAMSIEYIQKGNAIVYQHLVFSMTA